MATIGIVELSRHYEVLRTYALKAKHEGNNVQLFVSKNVYNELHDILKKQNFIWHIIDLSSGFISGIKQHEAALNMCDDVICCTQETLTGEVITKEWQTPSTMVLHELHRNYDVLSFFHWKGGVKTYLKFFHLIFTSYFSNRKSALKYFDFIGVASEGMKRYAEKKYKLSNIKVLSFYFQEFRSPVHHRDDKCVAVIPGTFDDSSRDYGSVVELISGILPHLNKKLELILLGKYIHKGSNEKVKKALIDLQSEKFQVVFYDTNIRQEIYDDTILSSDFLLLPLKSQWVSNTIIRTADQSYVSGNLGDVMRYGIPALMTSLHPYDEDIKPYVTEYDLSEKGRKIVRDFINEMKYNRIKEYQF